MDCTEITYPIYPKSTSSDERAARAGSQNEEWDISSFRVGAAEAAVPPSDVESLNNSAAASPLDGRLNGDHHEYPLGLTISIPSSNNHEHELSLLASMSSECVQKNEEEGSGDDESIVSELTLMTYRAELMKLAINMEFKKFKQQKKQHGVDADPQAIRTMFARNMMSSDVQKRINSFVNITSAKMKAEARQHHHLEEVEENEATNDATIQTGADELIVDFGVRPARSIPHETPEENTTRTRPSIEDRPTPPRRSQLSHTFNIHEVLQDRLSAAKVDTKTVTATNKAYQTPRVQKIVWNNKYGYVWNNDEYGYRQKLSLHIE